MPTHWKQARVCPIYKSGDRSECNNYRPISVLCGVSKIVERHVHDALYTYLTEHNLLFTAQSGFRPAFDLISHECLLEKLRIYQCDDNSSKWFRSYLTGRTQQTTIKGHLSETAVITAGIPQGSILGPLLFILYMNDLPLHIDNNIDMFADDSTLYTSGHSVDEIQRSLQNNLNAVTTWCEDNRMVLNVAKTKCMLITTNQRRHHLRNNQLAITLNDQDLQQVTQHKVIGVVVDENLQWREHVNGVFKKVHCISNYGAVSSHKTFIAQLVKDNVLQCLYHAPF